VKSTEVNGRPFFYRDNSAGDKGVIQQVFNNQDYSLNGMEQTLNLYAWMKRQKRQTLIVDAGANIGASPIWFASKFPQSQIIAIEPEPSNYGLLVKNTDGLNVVTVQGAIGPTEGFGYLNDPGRGDWGFRVGFKQNGASDDSNKVLVYSMLGLCELEQDAVPFICKIDIEGGEDALFDKDAEWMLDFPLIIIELHSWMLPGQGSCMSFFRALSHGEWDVCIRGENLFCFNNTLLDWK
jgi:FkbM family methyltransferase